MSFASAGPAARAAPPRLSAPVLRRCACGGRAAGGGECAECRGRRLRRAPASLALALHDATRAAEPPASGGGGGRPLPAAARDEAERRWGRPFGHVRVHDDARSGWAALALGARAFAAGAHIYVAPGQLEDGGRPLLLHETAHVAMQDPALGVRRGVAPEGHPAEEAARGVEAGRHPRLPRAPVGVYRSPLRREDFDRQMGRFQVERIFTATFEDQVERLNYFSANTNLGDRLSRDDWAAWDPGADSPVYDWILAAFAKFAQQFGGIPAVREIGFFKTDYKAGADGAPVPAADVVASFGGGRMAIFERVTSGSPRPAGRSAGEAPATLTAPGQEAATLVNVAHELGHGFVETALTPRDGGAAPDPAFMDDYRRAAGWTRGDSPELYDAGEPDVQTALEAGTTPPAEYRITGANWNDPRWSEQPVSWYSTTHPAEDIGEAIAFFVNQPDLLRERSPRRFAFLESRKAAIQPFLRKDLATIRLMPTPEELQRLIPESAPWTRPPPPPPPPGPTPPVRFVPGPALEIRF